MLNTQQLKKNLDFVACLLPKKDFAASFSKNDFNHFRDKIIEDRIKEKAKRLEEYYKKTFSDGNFPWWVENRIKTDSQYKASNEIPSLESLKEYKLVSIEYIEYFEMEKNNKTFTAKRYWYTINVDNYEKWQDILAIIAEIED